MSPDPEPRPPDNFAVNDKRFWNYVRRLIQLRDFLSREAVSVPNPDELVISNLEVLHFDRRGREPKIDQWKEVDSKTRLMLSLLSLPQRRRFLLSLVPSIIAWLPAMLFILAWCSWYAALRILDGVNLPDYIFFIPFLVWLACLGAIGAAAFVGMNALSIQDDITFDITNTRLIVLRITLGALFGTVLSFPFAYNEFLTFCKAIWKPTVFGISDAGLVKQASLLLLPFVLGFSTSLVILVMSRMVDAIGILFGFYKERIAPEGLRSRQLSHTRRAKETGNPVGENLDLTEVGSAASKGH